MKFAIALLAIAAVAHGFVIPSFELEAESGNVIDEIAREAFVYVEALLKAQEPFTLPDLGTLPIKDTDVDIALTLSGVKINKVDDLVINEIHNNFPQQLSASLNVSAPQPHVEGNFEVSGTVLSKKVSGKGTFSVDATGFVQSAFVQIEIVGNSILVDQLSLNYDINDAKITTTGLTVEGMTEEQLEDFLNKQLIANLNANKPEVCKRVANYIQTNANAIFKDRSLAQIIQYIIKNYLTK